MATARSTMEYLKDFFEDRLISSPLWPPRSPDLTSPDFFLWGFLKSRVYSNHPTTTEELKRNIEYEIRSISSETLERVSDNMKKKIGKMQRTEWTTF